MNTDFFPFLSMKANFKLVSSIQRPIIGKIEKKRDYSSYHCIKMDYHYQHFFSSLLLYNGKDFSLSPSRSHQPSIILLEKSLPVEPSG